MQDLIDEIKKTDAHINECVSQLDSRHAEIEAVLTKRLSEESQYLEDAEELRKKEEFDNALLVLNKIVYNKLSEK